MDILFYTSGSSPERWTDAIRAALPQATVRVWQAGDNAPADYAMVWKPPAEVLRDRTGLKAVFSLGAGVDALTKVHDLVPETVPVVRLEDAGMGEQMVDYATHAVLGYYRRFGEYAKSAAEHQWRPLPAYRKSEFTIGVLGLGVLGSPIAERMRSLGFPVAGWSRSAKQLDGVECLHGDDGLSALLGKVRVLICVLPLTPETQGIINAATLGKMPRGSYLINIARGGHVVEADLLKMVHDGHIAGATLDVFAQEPLPAAHRIWYEPTITVTPHIAALSLYQESAEQMAGKIAALERGETISGIVDRRKGY